MAEIQDLIDQSRNIANVCHALESELSSKSMLRYMGMHPEIVDGIVQGAQDASSKNIILYGLKESFEYKLRPLKFPALPPKEDITQTRSINWLEPDDVILGWAGYLVDKPRIIDEATPAGYTWRFIDDSPDVSRKPVKLDKFFQDFGWVKVPTNDIDAIFAFQEKELEGLKTQLNYFVEKQWAN